MRRTTLALAAMVLALAALTTPALAGGWAVTTLDDMPGQIVSGREYALGYTIRQHGVTPITVDRTEIVAVAVSGRTLSFPGKPDGAVGHYVATVFFPAGGTYTWRVTQGDFAAQDLGKLSVIAAVGTTSDDKKAATDKTTADKAAADKGLAADKAAALEKAAAADKAATADKAAAADKAAISAPATTLATQSSDPLRSALPFAAAAAAAMFIWRLVTMVRSSRHAAA